MIPFTRRLRSACTDRRVERGAIGVEYALLIALFAVTVLMAVDSLQGSAEDRFEESSADAGVPLEANGVYGDRLPPPTGGGPGVTSPGPDPVAGGSVSISGGSATASNGQKWDASVTVAATVDGTPAAGVEVVVSWSGGQSGSTTPPLETDDSGNATHTIEGVHKDDVLTFTITGASQPDQTFVVTGSSLTLQKSS